MSVLTLVWFGFGCFLSGLAFLGDKFLYAAVFAFPCFFMAWLTHKLLGGIIKKSSVDWNVEEISAQFLSTEHGASNRDMLVAENVTSIREKRKQNILNLEETIDRTLLDAIALLKRAVPAYTIGVFLPARSDGIYLRVWTTQSECLIPGARIQVGQGLVGLLLKEGVNRVLEHDIVTSSMQLHYYSTDEKVRSLAGVPIIVNGARRGAVIADSIEHNPFNPETITLLEHFASVIGQFVYHAYTSSQNSYEKDELAALTTYQRKFLENMTEDQILLYIQQYVEQSLDVDRLMILAREPGERGQVRVISCKGQDAEYFNDFSFNLSEKGLVSLVFEKEQILNRRFQAMEKIPRLSPREHFSDNIKSLLSVPISTDKGITHAIMVESRRLPWFTEHHKELLHTISRAAGFALSRARLYREKEQLSRVDGLTGLINHKTFQELYKNEILRAQRYQYCIAILMLDIDFFKKVNDTYGHPIGDVVLKEVGKIIKQCIRTGSDTVARYGGEEFVCLFINSTLEKSKESAERIRQQVEQKEFDIGNGRNLRVTLSIGAAIYPSDSKYGKELLDKADKALYHSKKHGRNKVVFYSE